MTPERIQRKRSKGWQMPGNTVYVGRPSKWGNPFTGMTAEEKAVAVGQYRVWLHSPRRAQLLAEAKTELRGKHLACWCTKGSACHADVLLEVANS